MRFELLPPPYFIRELLEMMQKGKISKSNANILVKDYIEAKKYLLRENRSSRQ